MRKPINSALDTVKVTYDDGTTMVTDYNADVGREEIAKYYYGNTFNIGSYPRERMCKVVKVEFPNSEGIFESYNPIKSARFLIEDENGVVIAEADTYEEAQTMNGATIIDTQNEQEKGGVFSGYNVRDIPATDDNYNPCSNAEHLYREAVKRLGIDTLAAMDSPQEISEYMLSYLGDPDFTSEDFDTVANWIWKDNHGITNSVNQEGEWENDNGFYVETYNNGTDELPYSMEDGYGHHFNLLDIGQPYPSYEDWENDVKEAINDEEFLTEHPNYLNDLYEFQDKIHRQYYGTDLIANACDLNKLKYVSSNRMSSEKANIKSIVSMVASHKIDEQTAIERIASMNNCNIGYAKQLYNSYIKSGIMDIADDINQDFNVDGDLHSWFEDYVPNSGKASTIGGELVRAANHIIDRYNNDGDYIGYGYGRETCNPAARYIVNVANDYKGADQLQELIDGNIDAAPEYQDFIDDFETSFADYLRDHEEFFHAPNKDAYEDYKEDDDKDTSVEECYVESDGVEYWFKRIEEGGWECYEYGGIDDPEFNADEVFDEGDSISDEVTDKTADYDDFIRDGWSYSVEGYDDADEDGEHHEWLVTNVDPIDAVFHKGDFVSVDELMKHDVYDMNGRKVQERDLY